MSTDVNSTQNADPQVHFAYPTSGVSPVGTNLFDAPNGVNQNADPAGLTSFKHPQGIVGTAGSTGSTQASATSTTGITYQPSTPGGNWFKVSNPA